MKKFEGVTSDGDPQSVHMTEDDYKALAYGRHNCIDEKSGRIEEASYGGVAIGNPYIDYLAYELACKFGDFEFPIDWQRLSEDEQRQWLYEKRDQLKCAEWLNAPMGPRTKTTKAEYYAFVQDTFDSLLALIKRKNADYTAGADDAFANFRRAEPVVPMLEATWVRWGDKIQRVDAYFRNGKLEVANEGLEDALLDVIGYSMIMLGELKEKGNV